MREDLLGDAPMGRRKPVELLKRIQELLRTKDVTADFDGDDELMFLARTGRISVRIRITARKEALIVRAHIPLFCPPHRRQHMCEAISIANFQLRLARFEMDAADGELICRADLVLFDGVPTDEQLTRLIYSVWSVTEQYADGLVEVLTGQTEPAIAMARAEAPEPQPTRRAPTADLSIN